MGSNNNQNIVINKAGIPVDANDSGTWPIQATLVSRISYSELERLDTAAPETAANNDYATGWAKDPSRYGRLPRRSARGAPYSSLKSAHITRLQEVGVFQEIAPDEVKGYVHVFGVPEGDPKYRIRAIKAPYDINEFYGKDTLMSIGNMATKKSIIEFVHKGNFAAAFDFTAFFDQFELHPDIGRLMCFKKGRKFYRLAVAPMGQRQSVELAHSTTCRVADIPGLAELGVVFEVIIDNVAFAGKDRESLEKAITEFVARVRRINGQLGEDVTNIPLSDHIVTKMEWGGVYIDFELKIVKLTEKILKKIKQSIDGRERWTYRNMLAHFGLLFWAIGLVDVNPGTYFVALQFYAGVCRNFTMAYAAGEGDDFLEEPAQIWGNVWPSILAWTDAVLKNPPRHVQPPSGNTVDWVVCVDSCLIGWGYVAYSPLTGEMRSHGARWTNDFRLRFGGKLAQSVFTEPHGLKNAACHLLDVRAGRRQKVIFLSDNVATIVGNTKGFNARSESINECMQQMRSMFPPELFDFSFQFLAGVRNTAADAFSRQRSVTDEMIQGAAAIMKDAVRGVAAVERAALQL